MMAEYIAIERCRADERFMLRVDYKVDSLVESINKYGQLQPGIGYLNDKGIVMVYMGIRRLLAVQKSYELYGRPDKYYVTIVQKASDAEIWNQILSENEERKSLSMLDKLHAVKIIPQETANRVFGRQTVRELMNIDAAVPEEVKRDWLEMERIACSSLTLGQLKGLSTLSDRWLMVVGAYVAIVNHLTENAIHAPNFSTFVLSHNMNDLPKEVSEYLQKNGIRRADVLLEYSNAALASKEEQRRTGSDRSEEKPAMDAVQNVREEGKVQSDKYDAILAKEERAAEEDKEQEEQEESLPVIISSDERQVFSCPNCGRRYRLFIVR
ncbi:MAG: ParB N-terminal domain-containing protein [Conexivisphaerales archaeon]